MGGLRAPRPLPDLLDIVATCVTDLFVAHSAGDGDRISQAIRSTVATGEALPVLLHCVRLCQLLCPFGETRLDHTELHALDRTGGRKVPDPDDPTARRVWVWWPVARDLCRSLTSSTDDRPANAVEILRKVEQHRDPRVLASLLSTFSATAWARYSRAYGPLPGGPPGVAGHVLAFYRRGAGRQGFILAHEQSALRIARLAAGVSETIGVDVDPTAFDAVHCLEALTTFAMHDHRPDLPEEWDRLSDLVRVAAGVLAIEVPSVLVAETWPVTAPGRDSVDYLLGCAPPPDAPWQVWGLLRLVELARAISGEDPELADALVAGLLQRGELSRTVTVAVDVLSQTARNAEAETFKVSQKPGG